MILLLPFLLISAVFAQYPYLKESESSTFGQCRNNADCSIYTTVYPSQAASFFICNQQVGRCSTVTGEILDPAFNTLCPGISMSSISFRSLDPLPLRADGIIMLNLTAPGFLSGSLRLFLGIQSNVTDNTTITHAFVEEQFANSPNTMFKFRNLAPAVYTVQYFDKSGCIVTHYPPQIFQAFDGVYLPIISTLATSNTIWNSKTAHIRETVRTGPFRTPISAGFGRGVRAGLNKTVWQSFIHTDPVLDSGVGQRVPYAHIYDISGGLLFTAWGTDVLWIGTNRTTFTGSLVEAFNASYPLGGVNFPLRSENISKIIATQREAMQLSGFGSILFGIGYAYRNCPACGIHFLQNVNGDFEGATWPLMVFNLSTTTFMFPGIDDYNVLPQHYTLNGIYTNTQFMYIDYNIFLNASLIRLLPRIVILHTGTNQTASVNSLCINGTVTSVTVYFDYTGYPFISNPLLFDIFELQMNGDGGIPLVLDLPSNQQSVVAMPVTAQIYNPGFYCALLRENLLDGRGFRPLLQTCFQIGVAEAPLTQTRSRVVPLNVPRYPYTTFAGLFPNISATFMVGLPTTLLVDRGLEPFVVLTRFAANPLLNQQIDDFYGRNVNVFNNELGTVDLSVYYTIRTVGSFTMYTLNANIFSLQYQFVASFQAATTVVNEVALSKLFIISTESIPLTRPPSRRTPLYRSLSVPNVDELEWEDEEELEDFEELEEEEPVLAGRRRLMAATASATPVPPPSPTPSYTHSQSQSMSRTAGDYSENGGNNAIEIPAGITIQYTCALPTYVNMIEYFQLVAILVVENGICPADRSIMRVGTKGGHPFAMDTPSFSNPVYTGGGPPTLSSPPMTNPVAYFNTFTNVVADKILGSGVGRNKFETPQNILIRLESIDATGARAYATGMAVSLVPVSAQIITFLPQRPLCIDGVQFVEIPFYLSDNNPGNVIRIAPYDGKKTELYDPNILTFDVPANCTLLQWFNEYDVYRICNILPSINATAALQCTGCSNLPIVYFKAPYLRAGNSTGASTPYIITTAATNEWWTVEVWTLTNYFNNETQRFIYCATQNAVSSLIPRPLSLVFQTPQRITVPICLGPDCFKVKIKARIDPCYALQSPGPQNACYQGVDYSASAVIISDPSMPFLGSDFYQVTINQFYNMTFFIPDRFCPVNAGYIPTIRGPFINLIRTYRSNCNNNDGSATIYASYIDPTFFSQSLPTPVCLYWPLRHGPSQQVSDSVPLPFSLIVNAISPTLLPNGDFVETQRFSGIRAGNHELMIYDRCPDSTCTSCLIPNSFQLSNPTLTFAYQTFTITNFEDPAGGIVIERNDYDEAACFGDSYRFNFTFFDNANSVTGLPTQRYEVIFFNPFGLGIRTRFAGCLPGDPILPPPTPFGDTQVKWGPFPIEIPTGGVFGLGVSGNYTFQVRGCTSGCVETFPTYIDMVQPFVMQLSSAGTDCAYRPAQLVPQVTGPRGFGPDDNVSLTYVYPGRTLVHNNPYEYCWLTPFNPNTYVCQSLQLNVVPGNYTLRACAPGGCCGYKSLLVTSEPAIQCSIVGYNQVCETSNATTVFLNCSGGVPPYRLIENVTYVSSNTTINLQFVSGFNTTSCYNVIDSGNCIRPTEVCFQVPNPGPVNITVVKQDSCVNTATGSISVTAAEPIQCSWLVTGGTQPLIASCTLTQLPLTASVVVTATTIIGCSAQQVVQINARPAISLSVTGRTKNGELGGACVDNITALVSGGLTGPPYFISLVNDVTNATVSVVYGNFTVEIPANISANTSAMNVTVSGVGVITITGVCRSYLYTILAIENDGVCAITAISNDPEFNFGGGSGGGLMGLGPPNGDFGPPVNPFIAAPKYKDNITWWMVLALTLGMWFVSAVGSVAILY